MQLRRAQPNDAPQLARIHVDAWRVAYRGIVTATYLERFTYAKREAAFRQAIAAGTEETYLVDDDDGQAVGILTIGASRDADLDAATTGELWGIYLLPTHWRRGLGTQLGHATEQILHARGCRDIVLWVLADNQDARRFYAAMGFGEDGAAKILQLGRPLRAIRYRKRLPPDPSDAAEMTTVDTITTDKGEDS